MNNFLLWVRRILKPLIEMSWSMQRRVDMRVLWPACKQLANDLDEARGAFSAHAFSDPCWIDYYGRERLTEIIAGLE